MSAPPYMRLYWADYHQDTRRLTRDEHGAYFLLIGEAWNRGGYLPDDDAILARWALATDDEWSRLKPIIMTYFLRASKGRWRHKRVSEELAAYTDVSRKRKTAGKRGGSLSHGKDGENRQAIAKQTESNCPHNQNQNHIKKDIVPEGTVAPKTRRAYSPEFEAAWKAYPHHSGRSSKPDAWSEWKRLPAEEQGSLLGCVQRFAPEVERVCGGKGAPCMGRWLKHGKHLNWAPPPLELNLAPPPTDPWPRRIAEFTGPNRYWNRYDWGEPPGKPGCTLPAEVQRAGGYEPAPPLLAAGSAA